MTRPFFVKAWRFVWSFESRSVSYTILFQVKQLAIIHVIRQQRRVPSQQLVGGFLIIGENLAKDFKTTGDIGGKVCL